MSYGAGTLMVSLHARRTRFPSARDLYFIAYRLGETRESQQPVINRT
jgi:hypothetical protein